MWLAVLLVRQYPLALRELLSKRRVAEFVVDLSDQASLGVVLQGLESSYPEAVIYSLSLLEQFNYADLERRTINLLSHPSPQVRKEVLKLVERHNFRAALVAVKEHLELEPLPTLREEALRTLAVLGGEEIVAQLKDYLDAPQPGMRRAAMVGLLRQADIAQGSEVERRLRSLAVSPDPAERILVAQVLEEVPNPEYYLVLRSLLDDQEGAVQKAALSAAGKAGQTELWPLVVKALGNLKLRPTAVRSLIAGGEAVLPEIGLALEQPELPREVLVKLVRVCRKLPDQKAVELLQDKLGFPDPVVRTQVLELLKDGGYRATGPAVVKVQQQIEAELEQAARGFAILSSLDSYPQAALLSSSLKATQQQITERLFGLLSLLYDPGVLEQVRQTLRRGSEGKRAYALEMLDTMLPKDLKGYILALLDELTLAQRLQRLKVAFPQVELGLEEQLRVLCEGESLGEDYWLRACALYTAAQLGFSTCEAAIIGALTASPPVVRETAQWACLHLNLPVYAEVAISATQTSWPTSLPQDERQKGTHSMYSIIEKVLILKTVNIFSETPDEALAEVAGILEELEVRSGERIIEKGELGDSLYIIVNGRVQVHNEEVALNILKERDIFGEMAVLDAEPRSASVSALEDVVLFRLTQEAFYDLMADRIEITRGIVQVLSGHVRSRVRDVMELRNQLHALESRLPTSA